MPQLSTSLLFFFSCPNVIQVNSKYNKGKEKNNNSKQAVNNNITYNSNSFCRLHHRALIKNHNDLDLDIMTYPRVTFSSIVNRPFLQLYTVFACPYWKWPPFVWNVTYVTYIDEKHHIMLQNAEAFYQNKVTAIQPVACTQRPCYLKA